MKAYERTHDNEDVSIVISSDASMDELIAGRDFLQSEIDGRTPTLEEPGAETVQSGPVHVVENEPGGWSQFYVAKDGDGPFADTMEPLIRKWSKTNGLDMFQILLSSIPEGYSLMHGVLVEDLPKGGE